jgi:hypothetical protein
VKVAGGNSGRRPFFVVVGVIDTTATRLVNNSAFKTCCAFLREIFWCKNVVRVYVVNFGIHYLTLRKRGTTLMTAAKNIIDNGVSWCVLMNLSIVISPEELANAWYFLPWTMFVEGDRITAGVCCVF